MSGTPPSERFNFFERPAFRIGPVDTRTVNHLETEFTEYPRMEFTGENDVKTQQVLDDDVQSVSQTLSQGAAEATIHLTCFSDELDELERLRKQGQTVSFRHWINQAVTSSFVAGQVEIKSIDVETVGGLGSDGSGNHRALAEATISVVESGG